MAFKDVIRKEPGLTYMLTNEAIVRYALEADVKVVSFYPGAPQTEILDTFEEAVKHFDFRMEIGANEKVALETVAGASMAGQRSLTSMKSVGTNVASDALFSLAYTGVKAGCVCLIADDPYAHSSQTEQDGRWFGYLAYLPMLEPSNTQEAGDMVKEAFRLSEEMHSIVLIRTTTRVNHQSNMVTINEMARTPFVKTSWKQNVDKYVTVGAKAREAKFLLTKKMAEISKRLSDSPLNKIIYFDGNAISGSPVEGELGFICAGVTFNYIIEALGNLGIAANILKIGVLNPIPEDKIRAFLSHNKKVVVVEELLPYIESFVKSAAQEDGRQIPIYGKGSGHFSESLEYNVPIVETAIAKIMARQPSFDYDAHVKKMNDLASILPARLPVFCAGCPHRATFYALRLAVGSTKNIFFSNDIGCYSMMCLDPVNWSDSLLCMGSSLGIAAGVQFSIQEKAVAVMGDSTFFHACLPGIVNVVHNQDDVTMIILENYVTAMTGQQSQPGISEKAGGGQGKKLEIRKVLEGMGVEKIIEFDTFKDIKSHAAMIREAIEFKGPSAIISHGECALHHFRNYRRDGGKVVPFYVDGEKCEKRYACINNFMCPALSISDNGKATIAADICVGCGECAQLCPHGAIKSTSTLKSYDKGPITTIEQYEDYQEHLKGVKK